MALTIARPAYCTRDEVKRALDIHDTARNNQKVDRAIEAAADNIDGFLHRRFYIEDTTMYYDWPNFQRALPWRIWFDESELADVTVNPPVVTTGGQVIPDSAIFWGPWNYSPPYTFLELDRSQSYAFGVGNTPQRDVAITGTRGYWLKTDVIGTLAASAGSTDTTINVSDGSFVGVGNMLIIGSERLLVTNTLSYSTGQELLAGCTTANAGDATMTVASGAALNPDEVILVDSERMLVTDITGNNLTVKRGWDGTILATHSVDAAIYAYRTLQVTRGGYGTTAASHSNGVTVYSLRIPSLIRDLALAEASVQLMHEIGAYSGSQGEGGGALSGIGAGLADKWLEAEVKYGRKSRIRVI